MRVLSKNLLETTLSLLHFCEIILFTVADIRLNNESSNSETSIITGTTPFVSTSNLTIINDHSVDVVWNEDSRKRKTVDPIYDHREYKKSSPSFKGSKKHLGEAVPKTSSILPSPKSKKQSEDSIESHTQNFDFNFEDIEELFENQNSRIINAYKHSSGTNNQSEVSYFPFAVTKMLNTTIRTTMSPEYSLIESVFPTKAKSQNVELPKKKPEKETPKATRTYYNSFARKFRKDENSSATAVSNKTHAKIQKISGHLFQLMVNVFDQFFWQPAEIRSSLSPACGVELVAYMSALTNDVEWALKAYDSSGRYRGQFLYGNDLWVGEKMFCDEINMNNDDSHKGRKHFDFGFFAVKFSLNLPSTLKGPKNLYLGFCLPKSCTLEDIYVILDHDPHLRQLEEKINASNTGLDWKFPQTITAKHKSNILQIVTIRRVPGDYTLLADRKFQIFCGISAALGILITVATIFERYCSTSEGALIVPSTETGTNKKEKETTCIDTEKRKNFELIQINPKDNNNVDAEVQAKMVSVTMETEHNETDPDVVRTKTQDEFYILSFSQIGSWKNILLCFAVGSNGKAILSLERNGDQLLTCIHGIRVLSLLWTIMVHTYLQLFAIGENRFRRTITERSFFYQLIGNATFSVDSFFFISGLLVTLLFMRNCKSKAPEDIKTFIKKGLSQSSMMIIYRYIRLTPSYLFVVFFAQLSLKDIFNKSVFFPSVGTPVACANYWWRNIFYINNWFPYQDMCLLWSWYLANDMQFYILAMLLLVLSTRYFQTTVLTISALLFTSWITSGIFSLHFQYEHKVSDPFESFEFLYDKPWQRIGAYIIGMTTGYIIHSVKKPPVVSPFLNAMLWIGSLSLCCSLVFGVWNGQLGILRTAFYVSVGHTAWGVGLIWITLSCAWGLAKPINTFLSYRGFLPLSRLTYCTYLIHPIMMLITSFQMEGPIHLEHTMILTVFLGNALLSFLVAFAISVSLEAPIIRLLKIMFNK